VEHTNKCSFMKKVNFFSFGLVFLSFSAFPDVFNKTSAVVWIKPESASLPFAVSGGEKYQGVQDGFAFVCKDKFIVYKLVDKVDAVIQNNCGVLISSKNIFYGILQGIIGGELYEPPDNTWNLLFSKGLK